MDLSTRVKEWDEFSKAVRNHITTYTEKQYGNLNFENPDKGDQLQNATVEELQTNMRRYINRMKTNSRGEVEAIRDLLKLSHYAAITWAKYMRGEIDIYKTNKIVLDSEISEEAILNILKENNIKKITFES